jgi:membrane protein DedA with SNARE-associated domain
MMETVEAALAWMETLHPVWVYAIVFLVSFGEHVVPPIPGDVMIVAGGYFVALGIVGLIPTIAVATLAGGLGFMAMYAIGRHLGPVVLDPDRLRWIPKGPAHQVEGWLQKYGYGVVAANRFLSGARSVIALLVGAARMRPGRVAVLATASSAVWTGLLVSLGAALGQNWRVILDWLATYGKVVTTVLIVAGIAYALLRRRRKASEG